MGGDRTYVLWISERSAGKRVEIQIYSGADHAFFNDTRPDVYDADAAADAWRRTLEFFRAELG